MKCNAWVPSGMPGRVQDCPQALVYVSDCHNEKEYACEEHQWSICCPEEITDWGTRCE